VRTVEGVPFVAAGTVVVVESEAHPAATTNRVTPRTASCILNERVHVLSFLIISILFLSPSPQTCFAVVGDTRSRSPLASRSPDGVEDEDLTREIVDGSSYRMSEIDESGDAIGGASYPPMTSLMQRANASAVRSCKNGATTWMPTGRPPGVRPTGGTVTGR